MKLSRVLLLVIALAPGACRGFDVDDAADAGDGGGPSSDGASSGDGGPLCSVTEWTITGKVPVVNVPDAGDFAPSISPDGRELYFSSWRGDRPEIWRSERSEVGEDFGTPARVFAVLPAGDEDGTPRLSQDGKLLLGTGMRDGALHELWMASRSDLDADFEAPMFIENVGSGVWEGSPWLSPDGKRLYFASRRGGDYDIYLATRDDPEGEFGDPDPVPSLNTDAGETAIALTEDELEAFVSSDRPGGQGYDLYGFRRSSRDEPFGVAQPIDLLNTAQDDLYPFTSLDGTSLYFNALASWAGGSSNADIWSAVRDCSDSR